MFGFGAYVGEVMIRSAGGSWVTVAPDHPLGAGWQPLVELLGGTLANPLGKAFKRLMNGDTDSIQFFYRTFVAG